MLHADATSPVGLAALLLPPMSGVAAIVVTPCCALFRQSLPCFPLSSQAVAVAARLDTTVARHRLQRGMILGRVFDKAANMQGSRHMGWVSAVLLLGNDTFVTASRQRQCTSLRAVPSTCGPRSLSSQIVAARQDTTATLTAPVARGMILGRGFGTAANMQGGRHMRQGECKPTVVQ